ncbi:c-type cytochrome biogenesis protein CcsB [Leifsonia bigeumensis]|uniref:C-type cytochrome biogenesis protein CcsB n=1 Tax=Leifsonella bigeumensis TaxID=433643 RepID=A0ABP7EXH4_9MICO
MTETFASYSLVAIYSAMAVYLIAFVFFTLDLAKRSAESTTKATAAVAREGGAVAASGGGIVATLQRPTTTAADAEPAGGPSRRMERAAFSLTAIAWVLHVAGAVLRGFADGHVPWSNMFEFSLVSSGIVVGVFLFIQFWQDLRFLGTYITGFSLVVLGVGTVNFYVAVTPLPPALQSYWLIIHVFVATLGTAFFGVGAGLSIVQLLQTRREADRLSRLRFLGTMPDSERLENLAYRVIVVGFVFWTFTLIAGSIWAERAWGRYWGWDTKEVWTFIIWVLFAGYIHARATRGWRGTRSAWLALVGMGAVAFNYTIVNLFFKGLHVYSGL